MGISLALLLTLILLTIAAIVIFFKTEKKAIKYTSGIFLLFFIGGYIFIRSMLGFYDRTLRFRISKGVSRQHIEQSIEMALHKDNLKKIINRNKLQEKISCKEYISYISGKPILPGGFAGIRIRTGNTWLSKAEVVQRITDNLNRDIRMKINRLEKGK